MPGFLSWNQLLHEPDETWTRGRGVRSSYVSYDHLVKSKITLLHRVLLEIMADRTEESLILF